MKQFSRILGGGVGLLTLGILIVVLLFTLRPFWGEKAPTTFQSPLPSPTSFIEATPQPKATLTFAGGIFDSPLPGPTPTPMPELTEVKLAEIRLLTFDENYPPGKELKDLMALSPDWPYETNGSFNVLDWATPSDVVVQPVIPHTQEPERPIWAINIHTGKVHPLPEWKYNPELNPAEQGIVNRFLTQSQHKPDKVRPRPSPNDRYLAIASYAERRPQNKLYVYPVAEGDGQAASSLQSPLLSAYGVTNIPPVWSTDGGKIAYGIAVYRPGYPEVSYEVHIGDFSQDGLISIASPYYKGDPNALTWSPDGRYIAFVAQQGDHEPLTLYVVRADATAIVNLMPEEEDWGLDFVFWSPDGDYIVFGSYGRNIWLAKIMIEN